MVLNVNVLYTSRFEISKIQCNNHKYFPLKNINTSVIVKPEPESRVLTVLRTDVLLHQISLPLPLKPH